MPFLDHLLDAPIANVLIIAGIVFLGIAAVGKITGKIEPDKSGRIICGLLGIVFLFGGTYKHASDDSSRGQNNSTQPDKTPHRVADVETGNALSGRWEFTEKSTVSGNTYRGVANLVVSGISVTGTIDTFDNSRREITGTLDARTNTLTLTRDTGFSTTQKYSLNKKTERRFEGTFSNEGQFPDSGTIELTR